MTQDEVLDLLTMVRGWWPHSEIDQGDPVAAARLWLAELGRYPASDVEPVVRRLSRAGREHAPTVGLIVHAVELDRQGDAPSFEDMQVWLARHAGLLPYGQSNTPEDTAVAVARLAAAGAHEAVLRFVASQGVYAVRMMPDPAMHGLGLNENADRRDLARDYRQRTLADWRDDPSPGRALARACRVAGLDAGELAGRVAVERAEEERRLEAGRRPALEAGEDPGEPMVEFDPAALHERMKADRERAAAERAERLLARRREEAGAREAARVELAEFASRRRSS